MMIIALFAVLMVPAIAKAEASFFESLYDVPVMAGLVEVKEQGMSFDKIEGRLAYAAALGRYEDQPGILTFYGQALPQMGWRQLTPVSFVRENEKLEILFEKTNAYEEHDVLVKFSLSPIGP